MQTFENAIQSLFNSSASVTRASLVPLLKSDGTPAGSDTFMNLAAKFGNIFYGTCSTDATTSAKTSTISGFILSSNLCVAIQFTSSILSQSSTLNISGTGAKPIYYMGAPLTQNVVRAGCIVMLQYDGTKYNVISIEGLESAQDKDLWVDMGLPSGVKWATRNIDVTQVNGFAASPYQYECSFFSFGNTDGHNPTSTNSFSPYDWGSANDGEPYASSKGATITYPGSAGFGFDAANTNLGVPWRLPTKDEFVNLFNNITYIDANGDEVTTSTTSVDGSARGANDKRVKVNNIVGLYIQSNINGNTLFFPCSGRGVGSSWYYRGSYGYYWSGTLYSSTRGYYLYFGSSGVGPQNDSNRYIGRAVRAVQ